MKDLFPGAGNQAFYQSQRNGLEGGVPCPDFVQCGRREGSDCPGDGAGNPAPCNNDRLSRDGFFQFSTADGTPRPAVVGDVLKVGFDVRIHDGFAAFALTNDVAAMAAETGDTSIHPPLTKWNVGFGQTFNAEGMGLPTTSGGPCGGRDPHRNVASNLTFQSGYNGFYFNTWSPDCNRFELTPEFNITDDSSAHPSNPAPLEFMNRLELTYTVGNEFYDKVMLTYMDPDGNVLTEEVRQDEIEIAGGQPRCGGDYAGETNLESRCSEGGPVPITLMEIFDPEQESVGPAHLDGLIFSDIGNGPDEYRIDNICIVIIGSLDECAAGPEPLIGDANGDGQVTGADLIAVQQNFGKAAAAPVPEPATAAAIFVLVGLIGRRRTRR